MPRAAAGLPAAPGDRGGRGAGVEISGVMVIYPTLLTSHHTRSFSTEGYRGGVAEVYRGGGGGSSSRERRRHRADFASTVLGACGGGGGRWWRAGGGCVASTALGVCGGGGGRRWRAGGGCVASGDALTGS